MSLVPRIALVLLLIGCQADSFSGPVPVPEPPERGVQWLTPEFTIPAYSEGQFCFVLDGPQESIAFNRAVGHQVAPYGHHLTPLYGNLDVGKYPSGEVFECTDAADQLMIASFPVYIPLAADPATGRSWMELPEGYGTRLEAGGRILIQSHYINYSGQDITVRDAINLHAVDPEDVESWSAPFAHVDLRVALPVSDDVHSVQVDCTWPADADLILLAGHMHEFGHSYTIERLRGEIVETVYDIPQWNPDYRDAPPVVTGLTVAAGDVFRTTCRFKNPTDYPLRWPEEMCVTLGMMAPADKTSICLNGNPLPE